LAGKVVNLPMACKRESGALACPTLVRSQRDQNACWETLRQ